MARKPFRPILLLRCWDFDHVALVIVKCVPSVHPDGGIRENFLGAISFAVAGLPSRPAEPAGVPLDRGLAALAGHGHRGRVQRLDWCCNNLLKFIIFELV